MSGGPFRCLRPDLKPAPASTLPRTLLNHHHPSLYATLRCRCQVHWKGVRKEDKPMLKAASRGALPLPALTDILHACGTGLNFPSVQAT